MRVPLAHACTRSVQYSFDRSQTPMACYLFEGELNRVEAGGSLSKLTCTSLPPPTSTLWRFSWDPPPAGRQIHNRFLENLLFRNQTQSFTVEIRLSPDALHDRPFTPGNYVAPCICSRRLTPNLGPQSPNQYGVMSVTGHICLVRDLVPFMGS